MLIRLADKRRRNAYEPQRVITSRRRLMSDIAAPSDLLVSPTDKKELINAFLELASRPDRRNPVVPDATPMPDQFQTIEELLR
jgi:hypothetical protein